MTFLKTVVGGKFPIEIPLQVGTYKFSRVLAESSYSVICLVVRPNSGVLCACKVVPRAILNDEQMFQSFERELRILQTIRHPNLIELVDVVYTAPLIYVVMEYCSGGDVLHAIHENHLLSEPLCRSILRDALLGLECLHRRNISHRDIKPENIFLDGHGGAKIADFGLSHHIVPNRLLETACGTLGYAAPEIVRCEAYDGRKADIWSCGVLLFAMCTGRLPWMTCNETEQFDQMTRGDFAVPAFVSPPIARLIQRMLVVKPAERPTVEEVLADPWLGAIRAKRPVPVPKSRSIGLIGLRRSSLTTSRIVMVRSPTTFATTAPSPLLT
jgi:serine/threonine protein kinase